MVRVAAAHPAAARLELLDLARRIDDEIPLPVLKPKFALRLAAAARLLRAERKKMCWEAV